MTWMMLVIFPQVFWVYQSQSEVFQPQNETCWPMGNHHPRWDGKNGVNCTELTHGKNESNHSNFVQNLCWEKNETPQGAVFLCLHAPPNAQQHSKHAQRQLPRRPTSLCWHEGNQHLALLLSTKTHRSFQQRSETASGCLYIIGKCVQMPWFPGTKFFNQF